jgi:hypothetical protein
MRERFTRQAPARSFLSSLRSALTNAPRDTHGWLHSQRLHTRFGSFTFEKGYPTPAAADALLDQLAYNRAIELYLEHMPAVSVAAQRRGLRNIGVERAQQIVVWKSLLDARTLLLTGNCETVYAVMGLDLHGGGPTVVQAPPNMLGFAVDARQRFLVDIGELGPDRGLGGRYLFLPPNYSGPLPDRGYNVIESPSYEVALALRGFQADGGTDRAVSLIERTRVYPWRVHRSGELPAMEFIDGSQRPIDTLFADDFSFFELLAELVRREPAELFTPLERAQLQTIGIEHDRPFRPNPHRRALLGEAVQAASAIARANCFTVRDRNQLFYPDGRWQCLGEDIAYDFSKDDIPQLDRRASWYYVALGNTPAMMTRTVGAGSFYLWACQDCQGAFLDGDKRYLLHLPPNVPAQDFWSVVAYDAVSRSQLQNGQPFPSISSYTPPAQNPDGSVDIYFGPSSFEEKNWIRTVPSHGWFAMFRAYAPTTALFERTWRLPDLEPID